MDNLMKILHRLVCRVKTPTALGLRNARGFTLIEMIGVLAVIAVLAALILPKVFDVISDSRINAMAASVKAYETAVTKYYSDIGSVLPLNATGVPTLPSH